MNQYLPFKPSRLIILLLNWLIVVISGAAEVVLPTVINFTKSDYKAASQNWSLAFDKQGYSYFSNNMGLLEFDGVTWKLYPSPNGAIIRAVAVGPNNRIYTSGYRELGYWERDSTNLLTYQSLTPQVESFFSSNEEFWNILINDNKVYFHAFSGVYLYESDAFTVIKPGGYVSFACVTNNEVFFTIQDKGIFKMEGKQLVPFLEGSFFKNKYVRFFEQAGQVGNYFIGTESEGLYLYSSKTQQYTVLAPKLQPFFMRNKINRGLLTSNGTMIIGTILNGIIAISPDLGPWFYISKDNGIQSNTVLGMGQDALGNIWLALDRGIDFVSFPKDKAHLFVHNEELGAVYTAAIYNKHLYVGTNQGLYQKPWPGVNESFTLVPNTQGQVWDCKIIDQSLIIGHNSGTFIIKDDVIKKISDQSGGYALIRNPLDPNTLIQCTYTNLVIYSRNKEDWNVSHAVKGFSNLIRFIEFDHLNNLWASHLYEGIYKLGLNEKLDSVQSIRHYGKGSVLEKETRNSRVFKVEGRIVFATGKKLYTYNDLNDSIVPYTFLNDNIGHYVTANRIITDQNHRYWFIDKQGMACFIIRANNVKKIKEYPVSLFQNHLIPTHENIIPLDDTKLLVCLENGYALLNTSVQEEGDEITTHHLQLREVLMSDRMDKEETVVPNQHIVVPYRKNSLTLRYSFPLINEEHISYQYKIDGLSDKWSVALEKPIFSINRIPAGHYILYVKAVNDWNKSSQINQLSITITPPWYQSRIAIIAYVCVFLMLTFLSKQITVRKVKLNEKRKRDSKEKELIQLRNEKLRSELSFKSQQLANSTMGIIKKNEFLMSLKHKIKRQKEQLGNRFPDKYFQDLLTKIDDNISGQDDWQLFEASFEQAHETFLKTLKHSFPDLTPSDLRLCAYLRINLTSKEIAPLLNISVRGVENHRYRLRKKLNLLGDDNLTEFIMTL